MQKTPHNTFPSHQCVNVGRWKMSIKSGISQKVHANCLPPTQTTLHPCPREGYWSMSTPTELIPWELGIQIGQLFAKMESLCANAYIKY